MIRIDQSIYKEMKELGLLDPEILRGEDGKALKFRDKETGSYNKVVNKKVQIVNRGKKSKHKRYWIEEPIWKLYIKTIG